MRGMSLAVANGRGGGGGADGREGLPLAAPGKTPSKKAIDRIQRRFERGEGTDHMPLPGTEAGWVLRTGAYTRPLSSST